jgi:hypothetical protein
MPWWFDLVLLVAGVVLWIEGSNHQDDTIGLLEKIIASAPLWRWFSEPANEALVRQKSPQWRMWSACLERI